MANWMLILYLFNGTPTATQETVYFESGSACKQLCIKTAARGTYDNKPVVRCVCRRGSEFYGYTLVSTLQ
jgi:hypothetical protein